jgi:hypothetical protein
MRGQGRSPARLFFDQRAMPIYSRTGAWQCPYTFSRWRRHAATSTSASSTTETRIAYGVAAEWVKASRRGVSVAAVVGSAGALLGADGVAASASERCDCGKAGAP